MTNHAGADPAGDPLPRSAQPVLLLGAGHGRRMGGPKVFTRHQGRTFLERILERCRETAAPVTLTVDPGFRSVVEALLDELPPPRPRLVEADGAAPMLESVRAALALEGFGQGFWLWPVDAPFLSDAGWARAVRTVSETPSMVWKLRAGGRSGHPIWFPAGAVAVIRDGRWAEGLRGYLAGLPAGAIRTLALPGEHIADVDTPADLARLDGVS